MELNLHSPICLHGIVLNCVCGIYVHGVIVRHRDITFIFCYHLIGHNVTMKMYNQNEIINLH